MLHASCNNQAFSFSSLQKSVEEDCNINPHKLSLYKREEYGDPSKNTAYISLKMRWMQKMMDPNCPATNNNKPVRIIKKFQNNLQNGDSDQLSSPNCSSNSSTTKVCANCYTTTTPLWRSGPRGPKVISFPSFKFVQKLALLFFFFFPKVSTSDIECS